MVIRFPEKIVREFPDDVKNYLKEYVITRCEYNWIKQSFDYLCYSYAFNRYLAGQEIPIYCPEVYVDVSFSHFEH